MIQAKKLSKRYENQVEALQPLSFEINQGEFVYLIGPSGSGKSTLIKLLTGEEKRTTGQMIVNQFRVDQLKSAHLHMLRRQVGIIHQEDLLLTQRTAFQNVAIPLEVQGWSKKQIETRVLECLTWVEMQAYATTQIDELSIGQRKRVAIARAIVNQPAVIFADEPTANLDIKNAVAMMKLFLRLQQQGTTVLLATHDSTMVNSVRHRVLELKNGYLLRDDPSGGYHLVDDPKDVYVW